jgi:spore maturation protein CgeB
MKLNVVIFGLSVTSSWGNGHATTYRALIKALAKRGHTVTFLEWDAPWYRSHRDLMAWPYCRIETFESLQEIPARFGSLVRDANLVVLGSFVPSGAVLGDWITMNAGGVTAFYDIDTPVTLTRLQSGDLDYVSPALIPRFDLYLSFTGGPALRLLEEKYGSPRARPLYCAVDPDVHRPIDTEQKWDLGYLGTYSEDRQKTLQSLLIEPAKRRRNARFVVGGAQYPALIGWPENVERIEHVPPGEHATFYTQQRFTLNVTRQEMIAAGYSPSVRLFEAAACGVPVITDRWPGLDNFLMPGEEIFIADRAKDVVDLIDHCAEEERRKVGEAARSRVLRHHTALHRAISLEAYYAEVVRHEPEKASQAAPVQP